MDATIAGAAREDARLDAHFTAVLGKLWNDTPSHARGERRRRRERCLERLERYRERGRFPRNRDFPGRGVPYFVDDAGVSCAMAFLMDPEAPELVRRIAREDNHARIVALAAMAELVAWLDWNGLSVAEAALVQPEYETFPADACVCSYLGAPLLVGRFVAERGTMVVTEAFGPPLRWTPLKVHKRGFDIADGDMILARAVSDYPSHAVVLGPLEREIVKWSGAQCFRDGDDMYYATTPADLPLQVLLDASLAPSFEDCVAILSEHDPAWGPKPDESERDIVEVGALGVEGAPSHEVDAAASGCSVAPSALVDSTDLGALALVVGAALALRRR